MEEKNNYKKIGIINLFITLLFAGGMILLLFLPHFIIHVNKIKLGDELATALVRMQYGIILASKNGAKNFEFSYFYEIKNAVNDIIEVLRDTNINDVNRRDVYLFLGSISGVFLFASIATIGVVIDELVNSIYLIVMNSERRTAKTQKTKKGLSIPFIFMILSMIFMAIQLTIFNLSSRGIKADTEMIYFSRFYIINGMNWTIIFPILCAVGVAILSYIKALNIEKIKTVKINREIKIS